MNNIESRLAHINLSRNSTCVIKPSLMIASVAMVGTVRQVLHRLTRVLLIAVVLCSCGIMAQSAAQAQSLTPALDSSKVTVVVFSSFGCPYCAKSAVLLQQMQKLFPGALAIEFRHFPLSAQASDQLPHLAALAADNQGKFLEFHDALFAGHGAIKTEAELTQLANLLHLDLNKFSADLVSAKTRARLMSDIHFAQAFGVKLTPTLFIQGLKLEGLQSESVLRPIIGYAIAKSPAAPVTNNSLETEK